MSLSRSGAANDKGHQDKRPTVDSLHLEKQFAYVSSEEANIFEKNLFLISTERGIVWLENVAEKGRTKVNEESRDLEKSVPGARFAR